MKIERELLDKRIEEMKEAGFDYLVKITAVDYVKSVEVVYFLRNLGKAQDETLEVELDPSSLWINTIMDYYKAADWYERELQEMFGVSIKGRKTGRLLLEKWDGSGYPLRKNFGWNAAYEKRKD